MLGAGASLTMLSAIETMIANHSYLFMNNQNQNDDEIFIDTGTCRGIFLTRLCFER